MAVTAIKSAKSNIDSVREVIQDFLVPELKALKVEMASLRTELKGEIGSARTELKSEISSVRNEMTTGFDSIRTEMRLRDENQTRRSDHLSENLRQISDKLDRAIDVRERLAAIEARMPPK